MLNFLRRKTYRVYRYHDFIDGKLVIVFSLNGRNKVYNITKES